MVASVVRKALAISAVVRPPSVRSVSATRACGRSAGWQQVKIRRRRSSGSSGSASASSISSSLGASALQALQDLLLDLQGALAAQPVDRLVARDPGDPGAGVVGDAVARPALERDHERLLHRLLGEVEVAEDADQAGDRPPRLVPEQAVDEPDRRARSGASGGRVRRRRGLVEALVVHHRANLDDAALERDLPRPLERLVEVLALEQVEAAELLLRLGEGAVGDGPLAGPALWDVDGGRVRARLQALAGDERAGLDGLVGEPLPAAPSPPASPRAIASSIPALIADQA